MSPEIAVDPSVEIAVNADADVAVAVSQARRFVSALGADRWACAKIATATSELARNIVKHSRGGYIILDCEERGGRQYLVVTALDRGPGIDDLALAMTDAFSSVGTLGLGLPSVRRLMDEFELVESGPTRCRIVVRKLIEPEKEGR